MKTYEKINLIVLTFFILVIWAMVFNGSSFQIGTKDSTPVYVKFTTTPLLDLFKDKPKPIQVQIQRLNDSMNVQMHRLNDSMIIGDGIIVPDVIIPNDL